MKTAENKDMIITIIARMTAFLKEKNGEIPDFSINKAPMGDFN